MRITHLNVKNVLGIRSAELALPTQVTLFAAKNGSGKTSLVEAIRMALTGQAAARGVKDKKDLQALVRLGEKAGSAEVTVDGRTAYILLPKATAATPDEWTPPAALPYVLDAQRFARMDPKDRRTFLFGLMGLRITPDGVLKRLVARGVDETKAKDVVPFLRAGFPEASSQAKAKATEAKGAWRALTGETYGAVKAVTWAAVKPEVNPVALARAQEQLETLDSEIADANQQLGALKSGVKQAGDRAAKITALTEKIDGKARAEAKLETDRKNLADAEALVEEATGGGAAATGMPCPCCKALLVLSAGALVEAPPAGTPNPLAAKLAERTNARDMTKRAVTNSEAAVAGIAAAQAELTSLKADESEAPTQAQVDAATLALHTLTEKRGTVHTLLQKMQGDQRAAAAADKSTADAANHHANVAAWDAIGDALAPEGIPGDMLKEALEPFNRRLEQAALDAEWPHATVGPDMEITVKAGDKERSYSLLSESEQWRVDAMLAEAVAFLSKTKLMVLDRFDVLDLQGRADLLAWLDVLATSGDVDTVLLFGTLKQPPSGLPATVTPVWIEGGVAQPPVERMAA